MIAGALDRLRLVLGRPDPRTPEELERDLEDELSFHLDMLEREERDAGLDADAARSAACTRFGDIDRIRAACRRVANEDHAMLQRVNAVLTIVLILAVVGLGVQGYLAQRENARALETISTALVDMRGERAAPVPSASPKGARGVNRSEVLDDTNSVLVSGAVDVEGRQPVPPGGSVKVSTLLSGARTAGSRSWLQTRDGQLAIDYVVELRHQDENGSMQSSVARWPVVGSNSDYFPDDRMASAGDELIVGVEPLRPPPALSALVVVNGGNLTTLPMGSLRLLEDLYAGALAKLELSAEQRAQVEADLATVRQRLGQLGVATGTPEPATGAAPDGADASGMATGVVYLDGAVERPGVYSLPSAGGVTVKRLVAAAGGSVNWAQPGAERLLSIERRDPETGESREVWQGYWSEAGLSTETDPALLPNDLVKVVSVPPTIVRVRGSDWIASSANASPTLPYPSVEPRPLVRVISDSEVLNLGELLSDTSGIRIHASVAPLGGGPPETVHNFTWTLGDQSPPDFDVPRGSEVWIALESEDPPLPAFNTSLGLGWRAPSSRASGPNTIPVQKVLAYLSLVERSLDRGDLAEEDRVRLLEVRDMLRSRLTPWVDSCGPDITLLQRASSETASPGN